MGLVGGGPESFHSEQMLQSPPQWPSLPALLLHCEYLCMCHDPGLAPLGVYRGMSSPESRPWPVPQGSRMATICRLSPAVSQSATPATGWEGDKGGVEGGGGGKYRQRGQQMPTEVTGDLPESILHPPLLPLQLVVSRFILSDTYHHCLSCNLFG